MKVGDIVRLGGYQPLSTMEIYERKTGVIVSLESGRVSTVATIKLDSDGKIIKTGIKFLKVINPPSEVSDELR